MKPNKLMKSLVIRERMRRLKRDAHTKSRFVQWEETVALKMKLAESEAKHSKKRISHRLGSIGLIIAASTIPFYRERTNHHE